VVLAGGVENIEAHGSGLFTEVSGTLNVLAGGTLTEANVFSGGRLNVSSGGIARFFTVGSGGVANVLGKVTSNTLIAHGGTEIVSSGGLISGAISSGTGDAGTLNRQPFSPCRAAVWPMCSARFYTTP
jgi:autotransporter passenger strand-loop-strand repeat protein